jgi:hypothetical protein
VPVVNIGRGHYNDLVIADPSVSTMHAKLQRREAIWILVDLGSTNGTFVEGDRLTGESPLSPGSTLRFGDVIALFEPLDEKVPAGRVGQTRMMDRLPDAPAASPRAAPPEETPPERLRPRRPIRTVPRPKGPSALLVTGLVILVAILAYLLSSY